MLLPKVLRFWISFFCLGFVSRSFVSSDLVPRLTFVTIKNSPESTNAFLSLNVYIHQVMFAKVFRYARQLLLPCLQNTFRVCWRASHQRNARHTGRYIWSQIKLPMKICTQNDATLAEKWRYLWHISEIVAKNTYTCDKVGTNPSRESREAPGSSSSSSFFIQCETLSLLDRSNLVWYGMACG